MVYQMHNISSRLLRRLIFNSKDNLLLKRGIKLIANPKIALQDVPCRIKASELPPNQPYTLKAETINEKGKLVSFLLEFYIR